MSGSSPLTRGKLQHRRVGHNGCGLIPAHAGKTHQCDCCHLRDEAHPRSRGENDDGNSVIPGGDGSSPLTRGKRAPAHGRPPTKRLIPAHAGKTCPSTRAPAHQAAHPRSRGENYGESGVPFCAMGSSPLTRGKRQVRQVVTCGRGLIPAHAGKTRSRPSISSGTWAHPRSRGENRAEADISTSILGSSPLTRGKPDSPAAPPSRGGLIPAHAGKTTYRAGVQLTARAHPRSRGENQAPDGGQGGDEGSSPLTRGKQVLSESHTAGLGLIPAHAGKTLLGTPPQDEDEAHPRSRGENVIGQLLSAVGEGSSPLTRGKHRTHHLPGRRRGLIPAHAGKTQTTGARRMPGRAHPRSRGENLA